MMTIVQSGSAEIANGNSTNLFRPVMCWLFSSDANERNFTCCIFSPLQETPSIKWNYLDFIRFMLQVGVVDR
jgi:hypothetical protein